MIWQTIRGRIIPFFGVILAVTMLIFYWFLLTRNKLSLSWNVFVNNVSHQQRLKNRYIFQLAIIIDKTRFNFLQQFCVNVFPKTTLVHHFIGFFTIYTRYFLQNKIINYCYQRWFISYITPCIKSWYVGKYSYYHHYNYINACKIWKAKELYMYKAAKRQCMVGSQLRSTISNMIKFLPLLLGL